MKSATVPPDIHVLVQQVQNEIRANNREPVDALRCVIERNDLTDGEGIGLFSAMMNAARSASAAVRWAA